MSSVVDRIAPRNAGRQAAAVLAAAGVVFAACGYDGPAMQAGESPNPAPVSVPSATVDSTSPGPIDSTSPSTVVPPADSARLRVAPAPISTNAATVTTSVAESVTTSTSTTAGSTTTSAPPTSAAPTSSAPPTTEPERIDVRRVLVIGDSSAAAMRWTAGARGALRGADFTLDLESCRRLVSRSCNGREGYTPSTALNALRWHAAGNHDTLIMATGYNDMDRNFADAFDRIIAEARRQGIGTIFWTSYREQVGYQLPSGASSAYAEMNEQLALRVLSGQYPELRILDWWGYTKDAQRWLTSDGVHFARAGAFGLADMISRELAALDGQPCPVSWELWTDPADPCPQPMDELGRRGEVPPVLYLYDAVR